MAISPATESILTVTALTRLIKEQLEGEFASVWVKGEITGFKRADSGHLYFALKDGKDALIDCVMWRTSAERLGFTPKDGTLVEAFGGVTVYEPRGKYQLVARELRPSGLGALLLALEELKRRLHAEGLFDEARKRPLPRYPQRIGLVTSPVGAAVRDLVKVLRARWPGIGIVLAPARVQGPGAAEEIAAAIDRFGRYGRVDLLIVGRGGGSLEDLWAFNEEVVVRAIAASPIPVISAVGHEVDWTLADLAADVRAATPSNAAEIAVRDRREILRHVSRLIEQARAGLRRGLDTRRRRLRALLDQYSSRRHRAALGAHQQRIDDLGERLQTSLRVALRVLRERLRVASQSYGLREWPRSLAERRERIRRLQDAFAALGTRLARERRARLSGLADRMRALSPRLVMERGYCLAHRPDGTLARVAAELEVGERLTIEFARGEADALIEAVRTGGNDAT